MAARKERTLIPSGPCSQEGVEEKPPSQHRYIGDLQLPQGFHSFQIVTVYFDDMVWDGCGAARQLFRYGLDMVDSVARSMDSSVSLQFSPRFGLSGLPRTLQVDLLDLSFDGSCLLSGS